MRTRLVSLVAVLVAGVASSFSRTIVASGSSRTDVASGFSRTNRFTRTTPAARPLSWADAAPIVDRLSDALPASLRGIPASERPARWNDWVSGERRAIAARIARGDEDSIVNLLLFGTSFTREPRITPVLLAELDRRWKAGDASAQEQLAGAYRRRAGDLVNAMTSPGAGERMRFARAVLERGGQDLTTDTGRRAAADYLLNAVVRVRKEAAALAQALEAAQNIPDSTAAFAERSRLFRDRGLAPDSSVLTQYAVDRAISALRESGVLKIGSVTRVGIVGPGLDFADKQEGFDFYDPQSLQPFTVIDSLLRSGAAAAGLQLTTIDVSPRVNAHLRGAIARARRSYRLVLPRDSGANWLDAAVAYWRRMGERIGAPFVVPVPSALPGILARGVAVRPDVLRRMHVAEANIVFDRLDAGEAARFDLVVATNVLLYYDTFEQTLAVASIASMLRPGGLLVTNDAVLEIPEVPMKSEGYLTVRFSERTGDGERMVWYRRSPSATSSSTKTSSTMTCAMTISATAPFRPRGAPRTGRWRSPACGS